MEVECPNPAYSELFAAAGTRFEVENLTSSSQTSNAEPRSPDTDLFEAHVRFQMVHLSINTIFGQTSAHILSSEGF